MDSVPGECEALGLVVFSNIIHLFIINDVLLTAFCIIFSTWLYSYNEKRHVPVNMNMMIVNKF